MAKDKYKNPYTGDLFGVEDCPICDGSGEIKSEPIYSTEIINDCEDCDGTGVKQWQ